MKCSDLVRSVWRVYIYIHTRYKISTHENIVIQIIHWSRVYSHLIQEYDTNHLWFFEVKISFIMYDINNVWLFEVKISFIMYDINYVWAFSVVCKDLIHIVWTMTSWGHHTLHYEPIHNLCHTSWMRSLHITL